MRTVEKICTLCGHSREAHIDGVKCAFCSCISRPRKFIQQTLAFRSALSTAPRSTRKR